MNKNLLVILIQRLSLVNPIWIFSKVFFKPFAIIYNNMYDFRSDFYREKKLSDSSKEMIQKIKDDLVCLNGPFSGMYFCEPESRCSTFIPKLLGCYEKELTKVINKSKKKKYTSVVNIGCAEGYYAVGFARLLKNTRIFAFDIDKRSRYLCQKMSKKNNVLIDIGGFCDRQKLINLPLGLKALIFMDCEGYENVLVDKKLAKQFLNHDFLIESHDLYQTSTTKNLLKAFSSTHEVTIISSVDDIEKAYQYKIPQLKGFSLEEKFICLAEDRGCTMKWIYAESKVKI